jgi:hypothetical protein
MAIQLTGEIKAKMRKMALIHVVLALISALALAFLYFNARQHGQFAFSVILLLNLIAIGLLAVYTRRESFP